MELKELRGCPFCGGEAVIDSEKFCAGHGDFYTRFQIRCRKCRKRGKVVYNYDEDALRKEIERWNNREQIQCPYVEKIKSITGKEEFDCKTCPALECPFPKVKEEREKQDGT